jgi:hypothetical protein
MERPEKINYSTPNRSELKEGVTYLLCPDRKCDLFWDESVSTPCESDCPNVKDMRKIIYIEAEDQVVVLSGSHHLFKRVEFNTDDGRTPCYFRRGKEYHLIYGMPKDDR